MHVPNPRLMTPENSMGERRKFTQPAADPGELPARAALTRAKGSEPAPAPLQSELPLPPSARNASKVTWAALTFGLLVLAAMLVGFCASAAVGAPGREDPARSESEALPLDARLPRYPALLPEVIIGYSHRSVLV